MFDILNGLLGGLGLFLVGMWLMTDGLKMAAGDSLRDLLNNWTNTRRRGFITGFGFTALVQSSSAVTVATIGFANAGILAMEQAIWVIFGSNVGTTMTGWIVALVGFKINMETFALPLVGLGMLIRLTGASSRRGAIGQALVGFGLFFLGIGVLKEAFDSLGSGITLPSVEDAGIGSLFLYVLLGFILTTLMQSSSAAIVITLSAADSGMIPLVAAAATVIGANLGTTTTAILSVWGATPVAKRVAASHVMFNLITGTIAIIIIMPMLMLIGFIQDLFNLPAATAASLALFHTVFNILGAMLMIPLADRLVLYLSGHFGNKEELISKPAFLDKNVLEVPAIAIIALVKDLKRVHTMLLDTVSSYLVSGGFPADSVRLESNGIIRLIDNIGSYIARIGRTTLPGEISKALPVVMQYLQQLLMINDYLVDAMDLAKNSGREKMDNDQSISLEHFYSSCSLVLSELKNEPFQAISDKSELMLEVDKHYDLFRESVLRAGITGKIAMQNLDLQLQQINTIRRIIKQLIKASNRLNKISGLINLEEPSLIRTGEVISGDNQSLPVE